jgi:hypothetical protein
MGADLTAGNESTCELSVERHFWLQVLRGGVSLKGKSLSAGDAAAISGVSQLILQSDDAAELMLFDLASRLIMMPPSISQHLATPGRSLVRRVAAEHPGSRVPGLTHCKPTHSRHNVTMQTVRTAAETCKPRSCAAK